VIPTGIFLLFWLGATKASGGSIDGWTFSTVTSYYFLLLVASAMLMSHIEEDVAIDDIQQGQLSGQLLRPFSYFLISMFLELPWRILQGSFGVMISIFCVLVFGVVFAFSTKPEVIVLSICISVFAFVLSFLFKMLLGMTAFWLTDARGLFQISEAFVVVFGGFVVPITLLPGFAEKLAQILPFSYMIYYPIVAFQGQLSMPQLIQVMAIQIGWIVGLAILYKITWQAGRKRYTAVGQ
jgi:ABC-2 type transport system permease protein